MRFGSDGRSGFWEWIAITGRSLSTGTSSGGAMSSIARSARQERRQCAHRGEKLDARTQAAGLDRYDWRAGVEAINAVYRQELRLWMNLYLPSVKLGKKVRVGSKGARGYSTGRTAVRRG